MADLLAYHILKVLFNIFVEHNFSVLDGELASIEKSQVSEKFLFLLVGASVFDIDNGVNDPFVLGVSVLFFLEQTVLLDQHLCKLFDCVVHFDHRIEALTFSTLELNPVMFEDTKRTHFFLFLALLSTFEKDLEDYSYEILSKVRGELQNTLF